jgi:large subunit ribosomal protein L13
MAEITKVTKHFSPLDKGFARKWFVVDASGKSLGRLAGRIAFILAGKHKAVYTPTADMGDHVVVLNAAKIRLSGKKLVQKFKFRHSGYPGGAMHIQMKDMMETKPERAITLAVKGMLPKTHLGRKLILKLNVYKGAAHPHKAQNPEPFPERLLNL